jgi:hypothetical protein
MKRYRLYSIIIGVIISLVISFQYFGLNEKIYDQQYQSIKIKPGEIGIIGYGSLTSKESMEKTLNRPYDGIFEVVELRHWERNWYASMLNDGQNGYSRFYTEIDGQKIFPKNILYLNINPKEDTYINCCLFVIDSSELTLFTSREWIYNEVDITDDLSVDIVGGKVIAYQAKPEYYDASITSKTFEECAVRYSYQQTLNDAFKDLGESYKRTFYKTTIPYPKDLLIMDKKEPK